MKNLLLFTSLVLISLIAHSQDIAISFYQGGVLCEGRTASNKYILECQNTVCSFDVSYNRGANGTTIMNVYNPSTRGFIPATYYIYPNNTLAVYANGYQIATGRWETISYNHNHPSFQHDNGDNKVEVKVTGVDCKGHGGSLCSCTTYIGYKIAGTNNYTGACQNYVNGHKCGHSPSAHGL